MLDQPDSFYNEMTISMDEGMRKEEWMLSALTSAG